MWLLLPMLFHAGCANRQLTISADVQAELLLDSGPCSLPCTFTPLAGISLVAVRSADGREKEVVLPAAPGLVPRTGKSLAKLLGNTLQVIAYPLIFLGLISLSASLDSDDDVSAGELSSNNDTSQLELLGYVGIFSGVVCLDGGKALADKGKTAREEVYVEFDAGKTPLTGGPLGEPGRFLGLDDRFLLPLPGEQGNGGEAGGQPTPD